METKINIKFENIFKSMKEKFNSIEFSMDKMERNSTQYSQSISATPYSSKPETPYHIKEYINSHFQFLTEDSDTFQKSKGKSKTPKNLMLFRNNLKTLNEPESTPIFKDKTFFNTTLTMRSNTDMNDNKSELKLNSFRNIKTGLITITIDKFREYVKEEYDFFANDLNINDEQLKLNE